MGAEKLSDRVLIRQETSEDADAVYRLVKAAFAAAEHSDGTEQDLVAALRKGRAFVPELSLVAEVDGSIVGHILFTEATVGGDRVLALAPLSVLPGYQRRGVGTALVEEGHRIAREMGYSYALVLGSTTYYPRFGYLPAQELGIQVPKGFPPANFMVIPLRKDAGSIGGTVMYAEEFGL